MKTGRRDDIDMEFQDGHWQVSPPRRRKPWLHIFLFAVTLYTTTAAGAHLSDDPGHLASGLPFSLPLMTILLCHEFGHFFLARRNRVDASLPYFIPGPTEIGTFGAIIRMRSPVPTRNALVEIGAAGPLAGFIVSIPFLVYGIAASQVIPIPEGGAVIFGDSLLLKMLTRVIWGSLPRGTDLLLHPVALAGWLGMFVTAMNLIPIGQLDGGHIVYALYPRRFSRIATAGLAGLVVLGIAFWPGWLVWAVLLLVIGRGHPPVMLDEPLSPSHRLLGHVAMIVFILSFIPAPFSV